MVSDTSMRQGGAVDAIDGVVPTQVVEPETGNELASALQRASRDSRVTVLRGGGTKLDWGRTPSPIDLLVSTARLNSLLVHRHGDLTVTAHAGVTLAQLNRELARYRQWLPLDSAFDGATLGGIVATNESGPSRHRHGTPRDLLIGVTLAMADGRLVKAGGHVVKNVAGYDLGKLVCGSFGSLAAIVDATFKLLPLPQASATLDASYDEGEALARDAAQIAASQLEPGAFDLRVEGRYRLLLRFASSPAAVNAQIESARRMLSRSASIVTGDGEATLWGDQSRAPWTGTGAVVRLAWLPAKLAEMTTLMRDVQQMTGGRVMMAGRVGTGAGLLRVDADVRTQTAVIERLRSSVWVGNVAVLRASQALKAQTDVWGPPGSAVAAARALKQMFDPAGILNAGRGPV
jgi:glycolate oxidase FAD binding subunit